jgi:cation diffusion facilitator family transporter
VIKLTAGIVGHSYALVADAVESFADVFGSVVVWGGLRIAAKPADREHPYGHGKAEPLAALFVAMLILAAGAGIAVQAVRELLSPHHAPAPFTLVVLLGVVVVKEVLHRVMKRAGGEIGSTAVLADSWHHRSDAITSAAAAVGIAIALFGGPGYEVADDWAALFASGVIVYNATRLMRAPLGELMDEQPPDLIRRVREVAAGVEGVAGVEKVFARKSGLSYWVDMHLEVDPEVSVRRAHAIAHVVKDAVRQRVPQVADVLIHVEPVGEAAPPSPRTGGQTHGSSPR